MSETIEIADISISVTRKAVKNVHLSVHPPEGRVTLVAPTDTRIDVARAYAVSRLGWIRTQQERFRGQLREAPRRFVTRESQYLWGRRHLLQVDKKDGPQGVTVDHRTIHLRVRPDANESTRAEVMHAWHLKILHRAVPPIIERWETKLGVVVQRYYLQRMKTKWGSCNPRRGTIRLNTELVKKPRDLLEYVVLHEMIHLLEPTHSPKFFDLLGENSPGWMEARLELNELPLPSW